MDPKERTIRALYDARARRDWGAVAEVFAQDIVWHEPGEEDYSADHKGRETVLALLQKLVEITQDTFQLVPDAFLNSVDYSAVLLHWWAERGGRRAEGNEIAVYRFADGQIAEVWFYPDGYDPGAFSAAFSYE